jgi:hypothetical protein
VGNYDPNFNASRTTGVPAQQTRRQNAGKMHSKNKSGGRISGTNTNDSLSLTLRAGVPLSELNLQLLDTDTKLVLAEKEQALLGIRASENWALSSVFIFCSHLAENAAICFFRKFVLINIGSLLWKAQLTQNCPLSRERHMITCFSIRYLYKSPPTFQKN